MQAASQQKGVKILQSILLAGVVLGVLTLPFVLASLQLSTLTQRHRQPLHDYGVAPAFTLTDQHNQAFSSTKLLGKVWIADFIFTRCATMCPIMTEKMKNLKTKLEAVSFISFSVDPPYDKPEVLRRYTGRMSAERPGWRFLTGTRESLQQAANGFKVTGANEPLFHSLSFILVDPRGHIRGYYHSDQPEDLQKLETDARSLLRV